MKKLICVAIAIIALGMTGCSSTKYITNSSNLHMNQTQVVLSNANFKVVKEVSTYFTYKHKQKLDSELLKQSAYAALVREARLTGSQTLIHVTLEQVSRGKRSLFCGDKSDNVILVSGVVIEFTK
ncbi:MAG: DUF6567 family protein [Paludibacteraceae bacterium]